MSTGLACHHSYRQASQARAAMKAAWAQRYQVLRRKPPAARDPGYVQTRVQTRLIREVAAIVDHDATLCAWIDSRIAAAQKGPGRPREVQMRTALIIFLTLCIVKRSFHITEAPELLAGLTWRVRRALGIDYQRRDGSMTGVGYEQLVDCFNSIANAFDAWDERLVGHPDEDLVRAQRADDLNIFSRRLLAAANAKAPAWQGNLAVDATLKWSWCRPPGNLNTKIARRGKDGNAGRAVSLSEIAGDGEELDASMFETVTPTQVVAQSIIQRSKRKSTWPSTWSLGDSWVGRSRRDKGVHGTATHSCVRADPDSPNLIEALTVTPAKADPGDAALPMLHLLHAERSMAALPPGEAPLGSIVADPAYTNLADRWLIELRRIGARPAFRLHRSNQEGLRYHEVGKGRRRRTVVFFNGRPMCECVEHQPATSLRFPKFPFTTAELDAYTTQIELLRRFEWRTNGKWRPDGSRQFLAPHTTGPDGAAGGCEHCTTAAGQPVTGPDGQPLERCCQTRTRLFSEKDLRLWQDHTFGSREWWEKDWNPRNRVEGSYGVLRNLAVVNWGRDYHHYVGLAREQLVVTFASVAHNFHVLRQWQVRQEIAVATADADSTFDPFGPTVPRAAMPEMAAAADGGAPGHVKGPVGLDFLGAPRNGPPPIPAG